MQPWIFSKVFIGGLIVRIDDSTLQRTSTGLKVDTLSDSNFDPDTINPNKLLNFSGLGLLGSDSSTGGPTERLNPAEARVAIDFDEGILNYLATNGGVSGTFTTITSITVTNGLVTAIS